MKIRNSAVLALATALLASPAFAAYDLGYELGATTFKTHDYSKTRPSNNFKLGYTHETGLGVDAIYAYVPKANLGTVNNDATHKTRAAKLLATYTRPFNQTFKSNIRAGLGYEHTKVQGHTQNKEFMVTSDRLFPALSAGLAYDVTKLTSLGLNVYHDARPGFKLKQNTYFTLGFNYRLPEGNTIA